MIVVIADGVAAVAVVAVVAGDGVAGVGARHRTLNLKRFMAFTLFLLFCYPRVPVVLVY